MFEPFDMLSLPIPNNSKKTIKIPFYPYDFKYKTRERPVEFKIKIDENITVSDIKQRIMEHFKNKQNNRRDAKKTSETLGFQPHHAPVFFW